MAAMNSSVLACNYVLSATGCGSADLSAKLSTPIAHTNQLKMMPVIRSELSTTSSSSTSRGSSSNNGSVDGRRAAMLCLAGTLFSTAAAASANAGVIDDYLEKSKANKELNDKKRLVTSGANFARAYTVQFGSCKFPFNFTGCQDLAKQKKVPFISDDLELECQGKEKYKCGSNVFWKW